MSLPAPLAPTAPRARLIAFYLPQFHPIPENDAWWGKGFTEWTNVSRARPSFPGHLQPRLPSDLGFYDLRVPEVRDAQAQLARRHGIEAFCYWHYWFRGRRLLERPFRDVLLSGQPRHSFCLAWANESWSRSWLGDRRDVLIEQEYSADDDVRHSQYLSEAFADPRYLRVDGRPLLLVYRPYALPEARRTLDTLRSECTRLGAGNPFVVGINAHNPEADMRALGFDDTENHEPQLGVLPGAYAPADWSLRLRMKLREGLGRPRAIFRYADAAQLMERARPAHPHLPCVFVGWDNTPRRGRKAIVMTDATPELVARRVREAADRVATRPAAERIVFLNAWNEWAEGMYLEPDAHQGIALLEAVGRAVGVVPPGQT